MGSVPKRDVAAVVKFQHSQVKKVTPRENKNQRSQGGKHSQGQGLNPALPTVSRTVELTPDDPVGLVESIFHLRDTGIQIVNFGDVLLCSSGHSRPRRKRGDRVCIVGAHNLLSRGLAD